MCNTRGAIAVEQELLTLPENISSLTFLVVFVHTKNDSLNMSSSTFYWKGVG